MLDEYISAAERFSNDLYAVGIPQPYVTKAMRLYISALFEPSHEAWASLYRHVSQSLQQWFGESFEPGAARRLFAFIDDDFGRTVLELPIRTRVCELLLQHRIAS